MKKIAVMLITALVFCMSTTAFAAEPTQGSVVCYPTAVTQSEDGTEIRKMYDLGPEDDPAGIPRSDFDQDGFHYTLVELLKQELPEQENRQHTETVTVSSKSKDMASVLESLPQTREFITEDGLEGVLTLQLESVKVEVAGYGSSTKELTASRTYPGLADQDTGPIPKEIVDNGHTLILQSIDWLRTGENGSEQYTAVANYAGSTTNSCVKGYTVTADYAGTVSRIILNKTRYVAIYEGTPLKTEEPTPSPAIPDDIPLVSFNWLALLIPVGIVALVGVGIGAALLVKRHREKDDEEGEV